MLQYNIDVDNTGGHQCHGSQEEPTYSNRHRHEMDGGAVVGNNSYTRNVLSQSARFGDSANFASLLETDYQISHLIVGNGVKTVPPDRQTRAF